MGLGGGNYIVSRSKRVREMGLVGGNYIMSRSERVRERWG